MKIIPIRNVPVIEPGDDLPKIIMRATNSQGINLEDDDVIVIAQSIVSKSEGNVINLKNIVPSDRALKISDKIGEDPRKVEVILDQTEKIVRMGDVIISQTKHGFVCADAGVDSSNVRGERVTVLPEDPDESARKIREEILDKMGVNTPIIISDSWGRPFRLGAVGFAIGVSGISPLLDLRGEKDMFENELETTLVSVVDPIAAISNLVMGETNEKIPIVLVKNPPMKKEDRPINDLVRSEENDLFR